MSNHQAEGIGESLSSVNFGDHSIEFETFWEIGASGGEMRWVKSQNGPHKV
ncbi:MAG: hypothetical protein OXC03_01220 [Flavobacteriaceae bacterium]|nr:hypothetical protein [Flavobacteriaceae bacterium]